MKVLHLEKSTSFWGSFSLEFCSWGPTAREGGSARSAPVSPHRVHDTGLSKSDALLPFSPERLPGADEATPPVRLQQTQDRKSKWLLSL